MVAADDGVMPQTREHLAILALLGVARGAVALTKADRADAARLAAVRGEIAALAAATFLQDAPCSRYARRAPATQAWRGSSSIWTRPRRRWRAMAPACSGWRWTAFSPWPATAPW